MFNTDEVWQNEETRVADIAVEYYKNLFTTTSPTHMAGVIDSVDRVVTDRIRHTLLLPYTENKVRVALF